MQCQVKNNGKKVILGDSRSVAGVLKMHTADNQGFMMTFILGLLVTDEMGRQDQTPGSSIKADS